MKGKVYCSGEDLGIEGEYIVSCHSYGIMYGCDKDCPVLQSGKCEFWKNVDDYCEYIDNLD